MAELTLPYESVEEESKFPVLVSRFEQQAEQRRLVSSKKQRRFKLRSSKLTKAQVQAWQSLYDARSGELDDFTWKAPIEGNFDEDLTVRFAGPIKFRFVDAIYQVMQVGLVVVNQDEDS